MNPIRICVILILLLPLLSFIEVANSSGYYDLVYKWQNELQLAIDDRAKLAQILTLSTDGQLQIVAKKQKYGVIYSLQGSLDQARKLALAQSDRLESSGFSPAEIVPVGGYIKLYHLLLTKSSDPKRLQVDYLRIVSTLPPKDRSKLQIEKIGSQTFGLVFHCWMDKLETKKLIGKHNEFLKRNYSPALIRAIDRPHFPVLTIATTGKDHKGNLKAINKCKLVLDPKRNNKHPAIRLAEPKKQIQRSRLNVSVKHFIQKQRQKGILAKDEKVAFIAYDLTSNTYVASINARQSFQAASMIKPFVALAFFYQVDKGKLKYTTKHRRMMERMIQHSDNNATNWFLRQLGGPAQCNALINKKFGYLFRQVRIVEYIPPGGKTYKNSAQPQDYALFLKELWRKKLPHSREMLRVMALPGRDRIYWGTKVPSGTVVYNKTGTTAHLCGDMGLLVTRSKNGQRVPYIIVGMVQRASIPRNYGQWMAKKGDVIRRFSNLVYDTMKRQHNLL